MTRARLFSKWGPTRGRLHELGDEATIGRSAGSTVRLEHRSVSGRHARIFFDAERDAYYLEDLGSLNGTRVDGVRVRGEERLDRLHVVDFGGSSPFFFHRLPDAPADAGEKRAAAAPTQELSPGEAAAGPEKTSVGREIPELPPTLAEPPAAGGAGKTAVDELAVVLPEGLAGPRAEAAGIVLRVTAGRSAGLEIRLAEGESVVGRGLDAAVRIDESEVSRRHAALRVEGGRVFLRDLGSRNHTYLEGERVAGEREAELTLPARVSFGAVAAEIVAGGRAGE